MGRPEPPHAAGGLEDHVRVSLGGCCLDYVQSFSLLRGSPADFSLSPQGVEAWAQGLRVLNLQDCGLAVLPQALTALGALEELNLARNCLQALPVDVSFLSNLRVLSAERSRNRKKMFFQKSSRGRVAPEMMFTRYANIGTAGARWRCDLEQPH